MAPDWARKRRPLVLVYTAIAFTVAILFNANVDAQGGAYATGVLVLMSSAAFAVTLSVSDRSRGGARNGGAIAFSLITIVFIYTAIVNIIERPESKATQDSRWRINDSKIYCNKFFICLTHP